VHRPCVCVCVCVCVRSNSAFTKFRKAIYLPHVCLSVRRNITLLFAVDGFTWNFISEVFFRNASRKLNYHKNQTIIYVTLHEQLCLFMAGRRFLVTITNVSEESYREHQNVVLGLINFSWKSFPLWYNVRTARQATMRFVCWVTENMLYLLLFHCNTWYVKAPQFNVLRTVKLVFPLRSITLHIKRFCVPCNLVTFTHL